MKNLKIIGLSFGDPWDIRTWSNNPYYLFTVLKKKGVLIDSWGRNVSKNEFRLGKILSALRFKTLKKSELGNLAYRFVLANKLNKEFAEYFRNKNYDTNSVILSTSSFINFKNINRPVYLYGDMSFWDYYHEHPNGKKVVSEKIAKKIFVFEKEQLSRTKGIFTFSKWAQQSIIKNYKIDNKKVHVVGHGYCLPEIEDFDKKKFEKPWLLFVSTNWFLKGGDAVLKAYRVIRKKYKNCELHIVGRMPNKLFNEKIDGIVYHGFLDKRNKNDLNKMIYLYKSASVFLLPSLYDPMPNVTLEANYLKTPVIASNVCGIPEQVIDKKTGFVIKENDPLKYAAAIENLLQNEKLRYAMGENGRKFVIENFSWKIVIENMTKNLLH